MRKILVLSIMLSSFVGYSALADDYNQPAGGTSTTSQNDMGVKGLGSEVVGIKPQAGAMNFRDPSGQLDNRGVVGMTLDFNASSLFSNLTGINTKGLYMGPSTGLFYSHIGGIGANFVGSNANDSALSGAGANMFLVPLDLKVGGNAGPFRLSLHGGGNLFYRSITSSVALGTNADTASTDSSWSVLPNLGADIELGATNAIAIILRPDLTFGGSNRVWTATAGLSIPLG